MAFQSLSTILFISASSLLLVCCLANDNGGSGLKISAPLYHRDHEKSMFLDPSQSPSARLKGTFSRSKSRVNLLQMSLSRSTTVMETRVSSDLLEFYFNISIGTPPVVVAGLMDTGSDLIWTQCQPCKHCFGQPTPIFDTSKSSTYKPLLCSSPFCKAADYHHKQNCDAQRPGTCVYGYGYVDGSNTTGVIATDVVTIGSTGNHASIPGVAFGCALSSYGLLNTGVIGLGPGSLSLVSQSPSTGQKFSYCLVPIPTSLENQPTSVISFGDQAIPSGEGTVTTPLLANGSDNSFYYLKLEAITVGSDTKIPYAGPYMSTEGIISRSISQQEDNNGNIVIDSGTTYTSLWSTFYEKLQSSMKAKIQGELLQDTNNIFSLCYISKTDDEILKQVPNVTFHFANGGDWKLTVENLFVWVNDNTVCFAIVPNDVFSVYGNMQQRNFVVGYDLKRKIVAFKPTDCTKHQ